MTGIARVAIPWSRRALAAATRGALPRPGRDAKVLYGAAVGALACVIYAVSWLFAPANMSLVAKRALELKANVDHANKRDLEFLWNRAHARLRLFSPTDKDDFLATLRAKLSNDRNTLLQLGMAAVKGQSPETLTPAVLQFAGEEFISHKHSGSGILEDAVRMIPGTFKVSELAREECRSDAKGRQATALKTLLIYANAVLGGARGNIDRDEAGEILEHVGLIYKIPLPESVDATILKNILLCFQEKNGRWSLLVPNVGYVFGGASFSVENASRGGDCSAFISYCVGSRVRLSTLYLDIIGSELSGAAGHLSLSSAKKRQEFIDNWQLMETSMDFTLVARPGLLRAGDIVIWRSKSSGSGHAAIVVSPLGGDDRAFVGISALRADDKSVEGIEVSIAEIYKQDYRTTMLRCVSIRQPQKWSH